MYQVKNIKSKDARIIIGMFYSDMARKVFCAAYKMGMYGKQYQWIIPGWFDARWWEVKDNGLECTPAQIKQAAGNYFAAMEATWSSDPRPTINGQNAATLKQRYTERVKNTSYTHNEYSVFAYDAIWAVALTLNNSIETLRAQGKTLEQFNFSDASMSRVFQEKLQGLHYRGMSGEIAFDNFGDRVGVVVIEQLQDNAEVLVAEYDSHSSTLRFNGKKVIWQGGSPPVDQTLISMELVSVSLPLMIFMTTFAVLGIILATGFLAFNIYYSNRRFIRMSSPRLNSITVIGCILIYLSVICSGIADGKFVTPSRYSIMCQSQVWVLCIGFTLAYGAMFSKTWRVHILFLKKIERRSIKDHQLLVMVAGLLFIDVIILITWQVLDPLQYAIRYLPVVEDKDGFSAKRPYIEFCSCQDTIKWKATIFTFKGLLLIFGAFLAWETRNVTIPALNDSKNIGISVYTVVLSCTVGLPVVMVITRMPDFTYGLSSAMCLACTTITLCLMFVPKIMMLGKPDLEQKDTQNERTGFYGTKSNAIVPSDSRSISSGQKDPPPPGETQTIFQSIRKASKVVQIKEETNMDCNNSTTIESAEAAQEATTEPAKDATESKI
ncbi:gamma-aminobutyric acid type B receptor subunit 2-like [Actinia tenebrosa]|uniref:Gamma-aminobutyric acid type B receptor subunit 2-like n=1 Tax=Actinia tenebrosa TaxID=6105 RepID=A0A6P8HFD5_ACTTE|nr:gamma-aminobutyric acid type B receptor subunit 2-like [Actinia tenebrosa]